MTLQEIFDHLSYGEFRQLFVADPNLGGIDETRRYEMLSHINLGLTDLHTRFLLRRQRTQVFVVNGLREYRVEAPDLLKVEAVIDSQGEPLPLNEADNVGSLFTTAYDTLLVPADLPSGPLEVAYRADHPQLSTREAAKEPERVSIILPRTHLWALLLFVASRYHNPLDADGNTGFHAGNNFTQKYQQECLRLENGGFEERPRAQETRFEARGFV